MEMFKVKSMVWSLKICKVKLFIPIFQDEFLFRRGMLVDCAPRVKAKVRGRKGLEIHKKMNTFSYFIRKSQNVTYIYFIHIYYHPTLSEVRKNIFFNPLTLFVKVRVGDDVIFVSVATERWKNQTTNQHQNSSIWPLE